MKPGTFIMRDIDSDSLKTYIQDRPLVDAPQRKVEWKSGYGVDGDIPFDENAYDNTELEFIIVINGDDLIESRQDVFDMLDTKGIYQKFIPYFDPEKIYRVMLNDKVSFENKYYYKEAQAASVKFTVKPYKYLINSKEQTTTSKTLTMINPTRYVSQPIIRIKGKGDITVKVNGVSFKVNGLIDNTTIDSERYITYREGATGPLESMNNKVTTRDYPLLNPGSNKIEIVGSTTELKVDPRWRSLI